MATTERSENTERLRPSTKDMDNRMSWRAPRRWGNFSLALAFLPHLCIALSVSIVYIDHYWSNR